MRRFTHSRSAIGAVVMAAGLLLAGCGVSGKTTTASAGPVTSGASTTTTAPESPSTTAGSTVPGTTETLPDSTATTEPGAPGPSIPLTVGAMKRELIRRYTQFGLTRKQATCVANSILKQKSGETFDPNSLDFSNLTDAAKRCLGADTTPGGGD